MRRTKNAIRSAFEEMVCSLPPEKITVKELTLRAQINRKTFYLHYTCIEDLYEEFIRALADGYAEEMAKTALGKGGSFNVEELTRVFFEYYSSQGRLAEIVICDPAYRKYCNRLFSITLQRNCAQFNPYSHLPPEEQNIVFTYLCYASEELYCQWVADGKKIPLDRIIKMASTLLAHGLYGYTKALKQ